MPRPERLRAERPSLITLATTLPAHPGDGTPGFALALAQGLAEHFDVLVLAPRMPKSPMDLRQGNLHVKRFAYFPKAWEGLATAAIMPTLRAQPWRLIEVPCLVASMLIAAWRSIWRSRPAALHAHWIVPAGLIAWVLQKVTGVPYVLTVHGTDVYGLRSRWYRMIRDRIVAGAYIFLPVSKHLARTLDLEARGIRHEVIPMGAEPDTNARDDRRDRAHFLFVGRLADQKGVDTLLRAAQHVPEARLTLVGDGPEHVKLRYLCDALQLQDRVRFVGQLPHDEVMYLMRSAAAVVIPSRESRSGDLEGTPVVLAEALATRTPVIASAIGGIAEQLSNGTTGVLVDAGSPEILATAMRMAIEDPARMQRLADNAWAEVMPRLDIRNTAQRYATYFLEIASSN